MQEGNSLLRIEFPDECPMPLEDVRVDAADILFPILEGETLCIECLDLLDHSLLLLLLM